MRLSEEKRSVEPKAPFTKPVQGGNVVLVFHPAILYKRYKDEINRHMTVLVNYCYCRVIPLLRKCCSMQM